jgi:hypothetical protein
MRDTLEKLNKQIHNNEDAQLAKKYFNDNIDPLIELIKRKEPKQDEGLNKTTKSWERLRDPSNKHSNFDLKNLANNVNNLIEDQHVINEKTNELNDKINKYRDMINNIPDKNSTKYNDEVLRLKKVDNELETVENIAKEEQEKLDKLKNRLNNVQAAHTAQNYYNDFLKPDCAIFSTVSNSLSTFFNLNTSSLYLVEFLSGILFIISLYLFILSFNSFVFSFITCWSSIKLLTLFARFFRSKFECLLLGSLNLSHHLVVLFKPSSCLVSFLLINSINGSILSLKYFFAN